MSTAMRLSATITCLSLSVFFALNGWNWFRTGRVEALKTRKTICEMLAIHSSLDVQPR